MKKYRITSLKKNPYDYDHEATDPDALYSWMILVRDGCESGSSTHYNIVEAIIKFYGFEKPEDLVGLEFETPDDTFNDHAFERLYLDCTHEGHYIPPSNEELYERAVSALAGFELPDYEDVDTMTVAIAYSKVYHDENWFRNFCRSVHERSGGKVSIEDAKKKEFTLTIMGSAKYLYLIRDEEKRRMTFGPYGTPFEFDISKEAYERWKNSK